MTITSDQAELDTILSALAHHKRRSIIRDLSFQPATVKQLAERQEISLPAIHKHIRILEQSQLILRKKVGRTNFVALNAHTLNILKDWIMQYHTKWGSVDATLDNYISKMQE